MQVSVKKLHSLLTYVNYSIFGQTRQHLQQKKTFFFNNRIYLFKIVNLLFKNLLCVVYGSYRIGRVTVCADGVRIFLCHDSAAN